LRGNESLDRDWSDLDFFFFNPEEWRGRTNDASDSQACIFPLVTNQKNVIDILRSNNYEVSLEWYMRSQILHQEFIPPRDEQLHYVQSYINIQKYKYADRFSIHCQVSRG
jgi:hypothetical protein